MPPRGEAAGVSDRLAVRPVRDADAERVRALHRAALAPTGTDPTDLPDRGELDAPATAYDGPDEAFLVGEVDGEVVAMGALRPAGAAAGDAGADDAGPGTHDGESPAPVGELKWMRVAPHRQGGGHGRALLEALEAEARERGYGRLVAETAVRQGSASFYARHGYAETARRRYGDYELVTLEKAL